MAPRYDSSIAWFVEENDDLVRIAISHRLDGSLGGAALTTALKDSMDEADSRGWAQPDIDKAWGKWASMGTQTGDLGKSLADGENSLARQDHTEVETAWSMAQRYAQEGNEKQERKLLRAIRKYYRERKLGPGSVEPVSRYELAERYYRLGRFAAAEELLSVKPDKPEHAAILAAIAQKRERYGVLAGSTSEDKEAEVLVLIPKALKLGYAAHYTRADALLSAAQRRNPRVSGISTARCDLSTRERQFARAAKQCSRAIALHKGSSRAHYLAGGIAYQRRKRDKALKHLETAVAIDPGANAAWRLLAKIVRDSDDLSELQALRDRHQKIHGRSPSF